MKRTTHITEMIIEKKLGRFALRAEVKVKARNKMIDLCRDRACSYWRRETVLPCRRRRACNSRFQARATVEICSLIASPFRIYICEETAESALAKLWYMEI